MMEDSADQIRQGQAEYLQSRFGEAILLFARAREVALNLSDQATAFEAGVWEAESRRMQGRLKDALALLLPLLAHPPTDAPIYERWLAQKIAMEILEVTRPELSQLRLALDEIILLAQQLPHPAADIPSMEGDLCELQGHFSSALAYYTQAWHEYDGQGYARHNYPYHAAIMAMALHRRPDALAWRNHLAQTEQDIPHARQRVHIVNCLLALFTNDQTALAECRDAGFDDKIVEARVHIALRGTSQQPQDDPLNRFHSARAALRDRPSKSVHDQYNYRLAVVDYHLASLRYGAGLAAVDDLYYQQPDVVSSQLPGVDPASFALRLKRFHCGWRRLNKHARWLDGLLQCDYRTKESESRLIRCDTIERAVTGTHEAEPLK